MRLGAALAVAGVSATLVAGATLPGVPRPASLTLYSSPNVPPGCAARVVADWVDDGRVQGRYGLHCYREAIDSLPEDMRAYSSAPDDLERALHSAAHPDANARTTESTAR